MLQLLFYIFFIAVVLQILYYLFIFNRFAFLKKNPSQKNEQSVSVVIAVHNEAENLKKFLPKVLSQNYSNFEIVIVNDASTDSTLEVLNSFNNEKLKIVTIPSIDKYHGNKKNAITKGIEVANYDNLLFTDADCYPNSKNWISEITSHLNENITIVLGYGAYEKKPSFINKLIRYETLLTVVQYFSYANLGVPYMGVGRNLAYKKELFTKVNGFATHQTVKSGDDDLFINEVSDKNNISTCYSKGSFTISKPKTTFGSWFRQKRRHISTANYYKPIHQFLLGLFYFSQLSFWLLAIILLVYAFNWQLVTILVVIRLISQYISMYNAGLKLNEKDLTILTPILDIILVCSLFALFITNLISKPKHW